MNIGNGSYPDDSPDARCIILDMEMAVIGKEAATKITYGEFRQFPDDGKLYELIHGEVRVAPAPNTKHQTAHSNLFVSLGPHVKANRLGVVFSAPFDVRLDIDSAVQPDLIFISNARAEIILEDYIDGAPDLVVEILSPSTAAYDRAAKLALYAEAGVPWVWLVDPQAKTVEILKIEGRKYIVHSILAAHQVLISSLFPGWQLPLDDLFDFRTQF
ncbi:MAG TPA: Uma2 family endonuclease [Terriglobia bacterium]|nr:Uma2 family endonuclease [Terriglobia bacterium]